MARFTDERGNEVFDWPQTNPDRVDAIRAAMADGSYWKLPAMQAEYRDLINASEAHVARHGDGRRRS